MFDNLDDPRKQAMLAMAFGLLGGQGGKGAGGFARDLGQAGLLGLNRFAVANEDKRRSGLVEDQRKMQQFQFDQAKRGAEDQDFARQIAPNYFSPQVSPLTPNDDEGNAMPSSQAKADFMGYGQALAARNPQMGAQFMAMAPKPEKPKWAIAPNGQPVDMNNLDPTKNFAPTPDWKDHEYREFKKGVAKEGAPQVNVKYGGNLASELGKGTAAVLNDGRTKAEAAVESIKQGHQILGTLDSGPSYTGPGASLKLKAAQIAPMLGFKPDETGIRNTRELIVGLANQTINARGLLKGQGQITEYEQKTLQKAKSGEIDDMTPDEIRALVRVNERASRAQIAAHGKIVGSLAKKPEFAEAIPFFQIDSPEEYAPRKPAAQGGLSPAEEQELARLRAQFGKR